MTEPDATELFTALVALASVAHDAQALLLGIEMKSGEHYHEQDQLKAVLEGIVDPAIARGRQAIGPEKGGA